MSNKDESIMKIYADFNSLEECSPESSKMCLNLTGYGTLASLSFHKLKLKEGEILVFSDPEGLEVNGITYFDENRVSENCSGWFAKFERDDISEGEPLDHDYDIHTCFTCRNNIKPHLNVVGRQFKEYCPFCGTSVMFPLLAP